MRYEIQTYGVDMVLKHIIGREVRFSSGPSYIVEEIMQPFTKLIDEDAGCVIYRLARKPEDFDEWSNYQGE